MNKKQPIVGSSRKVYCNKRNLFIFYQQLTKREREVALLVSDGKTNCEIGYKLNISTKTVEKHISNIYRKFDAHSRVEITRILIQGQMT